MVKRRKSRTIRAGETAMNSILMGDLLSHENDSETIINNNSNFFSFFSSGIQEKTLHNEKELTQKYREYSEITDISNALDIISGEAVIYDENIDERVLNINIKKIPYFNAKTRDLLEMEILESFDKIYNTLNFDVDGESLFRRWYIDAKLYLWVDFDDELSEGLNSIYYLDPIRLSKHKQGAEVYYRYTLQKDKDRKQYKFIDIPEKHIYYLSSGLIGKKGLTMGYLNKAIRPMSALKMMENSVMISVMSRAPERFKFKLYTSGMATPLAEQYMRSLARRYSNRFYIDGTTGEIRGDVSRMSVIENFYFGRDKQGEGHDVEAIKGTDPMTNIGLLEYYWDKAINSLNIDPSLLQNKNSFGFGAEKEDNKALKDLYKFISKLRRKSIKPLFMDLIKKDLILRNIITPDMWEYMNRYIQFKYNNDNKMEELKLEQKLTSMFEKYPQAKQMYLEGFMTIEDFYKIVYDLPEHKLDEVKSIRKSNLVNLASEKKLMVDLNLKDKDEFNDIGEYE